jgi:hypothetical protein
MPLFLETSQFISPEFPCGFWPGGDPQVQCFLAVVGGAGGTVLRSDSVKTWDVLLTSVLVLQNARVFVDRQLLTHDFASLLNEMENRDEK